MEVWEKVILDEAFLQDIHGKINCLVCHGGVSGADDKDKAHQGMMREPDSTQTCGLCHVGTHTEANSLHSTLAGYYTVLQARGDEATWPAIQEAFDNHCAGCHTGCGQCHVSRPTSTGGGLVEGHLFKKIPPMNLTCTGCHGSRIQDEYKGKNEGVQADVHWVKGGMPCFDCHSADEMHGALGTFDHRYDGPQTPSCSATGLGKECHADMALAPEIEQHDETHLKALSCQVCHSTTYKHCYGCHVGQKDGQVYFKTEPTQMLFKIGHNLRRSPERPWEYVPVRHVPIARDSFEYYGRDLLPNFDALPTWKYTTPHNIQRITPQTGSCNACHGNAEFFLTADDVLPDEMEANQDVIVPQVPEAVEEGQ